MLSPFITGGGAVKNTTYESTSFKSFPDHMEAGLPNIAGIIGLGAASTYLQDIGMQTIAEHEETLTMMMRDGLENIAGVERVGHDGTGIISFRIDNVKPTQTALILDQRGIAVRSGMHCVHSWFNEYEEESTVRASLHLYNDEDDIKSFLEAVKKISLLS